MTGSRAFHSADCAIGISLGESSRYRRRVSNPSPESYRWVADEEFTWFAVAGCVTVVAGSGPEGALTAIGADLEQSARLEDVVDTDGLSWVSASRLESPAPGEASVLLEDNGWEGSRPEVLARLSKAGKAAAVYWNVNGLVIFACARRGKVLAHIEMPAVDDVDGVPRNLLRLLREADRHPDTVAVAMAMAEKFTGIPVPPTPAICRPATAHPITQPVLGLRVTTDELLGLGYPTPELVAAVQTATPAARRRLAEWSATQAVEKAELTNEPGVIAMLDQFGQGRPTRQSAQTAALRRLAQRGAAAADTALIVDGDGDPARRHKIRHSYDMYWAMEALAYTAAGDDVTAALGATYCASIPHRSDNTEADFLSAAPRVLEG